MQLLAEILLSNLVIAGGLAIIAFGLRKAGGVPHLVHALWLLVLVKLVTPPLVSLPILPEIEATDNDSVVPAFIPMPSDEIDAGPTVVSEIRTAAPPLGKKDAQPASSFPNAHSARSSTPRSNDLHEPALWVFACWSIGTIALVSLALLRHRRLLRIVAEGQDADEPLGEITRRLARQMRLTTCPAMRITNGQLGPLVVIGWRQQTILLPRQLLDDLSPEQVRAVLAHELAHICRQDHWVRLFELAVLAVQWWNPLAWWASRELHRAAEDCCDAYVVWTLPDCRRAYGQALVRTVEFLSEQRPARFGADLPFGRTPFQSRIEAIMNRTTSPRMTRSHWVAVGLIALLALPLAVQESNARDEKPATVSTSAPAAAKTVAPAATPAATPAPNPDPGIMQQIREAWQKRVQRFENMRIVYTEIRPLGESPAGFSFGTPVDAIVDPLEHGSFSIRTSHYDLVLSGNKSRMRDWWNIAIASTNEVPGELKQTYSHETLYVFNGTTAKSMSPNPELGYTSGTIGSEPEWHFDTGNFSPVRMACRPPEPGSLPVPLEDYELVSAYAELDGRPVVQLETRKKKPLETVWLDPKHEFVIVRKERVRDWSSDEVRNQFRISYRNDKEWGPVPTAWSYRQYFKGDVDDEFLGKVIQFEVNPEIHDGDFEITFAPGTIYSERKKRNERSSGPTKYFIVESDGTSRQATGQDFKKATAGRKKPAAGVESPAKPQ